MHSKKIRYMVLALLVIMAGILYSILSYHVIIMLDEPLDTLQGVLIYGIIPRVIELVAISLICIGIQENSSGEVMRLAANIAWRHHERYDGKGYQNELSGEKINLYARSVPWLSLKTKTN